MTAQHDFIAITSPHLPRLTRIGLRLTNRPDEAEDLVQETIVKAWSAWDRYDDAGSVGAWLSRILINTFISRHRHQKVVDATAARPDLLGHLFDQNRLDEAAAPEGNWHSTHFSDEVMGALSQLPTHYREVIEIVDVQGLAYREAATELGCPLGTVMSRIHRGRQLLRELLADYARAHHGLGVAA